MKEFSEASGLEISLAKSKIFVSPNISRSVAQQLSSSCNINLTDNLGMYLGVPIVHGRQHKGLFAEVVDKMRRKMASWKRNVLSRAGRRTLIQSVMSSIPIYNMQSTLLPISICSQLDQINRNFLWGGKEQYGRNHLVSWDMVCKPTKFGGLGLRKTRDMNVALLSKVGWALETGDGSLSSMVLREKYLNDASFKSVTPRAYNSCSWRGILKCRSCLELGKKWLIGPGTMVDFWRDRWAGDTPLINCVADNAGVPPDIVVVECMNDRGKWDLDTVNHFLPPEKINTVRAVPIPRRVGCEDRLFWRGEPSGYFSTSSAYKLLIQDRGGKCDGRYTWIWKLKVPEKVRFFLWLLSKDRLNTNEMRVRRRMTQESAYPRCQAAFESVSHIFRECHFVVEVWRKWQSYGHMAGMDAITPFNEWLANNCSSSSVRDDEVWWKLSFALTLWSVWKGRNDLIFNQKYVTPDAVWWSAKQMAKEVMDAYASALTSRVREQRWVGWLPPATGCVILNTDGAWKRDRDLASAGGLLRDSNGMWLKGFMINIGSTNSLMAELWAVREGLFIARSLNVGSLIVELDAAIVVGFLKNGVSEIHPCRTLVKDCQMIMEGEWITDVRHILRQGNRCTDKLANLAQDLPLGVHIIDEAPEELASYLADDRIGVKFLRI